MNKKRPMLITIIADLNFFSALFSIVVLFFNHSNQYWSYDEPLTVFPSSAINILTPILGLVTAYGCWKLKKWGYWLIVVYDLLFLSFYIVWMLQNKQLHLSQNFIWVFMELLFILPTKRYFYETFFVQE